MRFCNLFTVKHALILLLAGIIMAGTAIEAVRFAQTQRAADSLQQQLFHKNSHFRALQADIQAQTEDMNFLRGLVNVLPQEKSFLRTQQAIEREVELLRRKVSRKIRNDIHIVVDTQANKLYAKQGLTLLWQADCSAGKGGTLTDKKTGQRWEFVTPRGQFEVRDKIADPLWIKPDWAFVETNEKIPPPGDPTRAVKDELGAFVMSLGDGYLIHGTKNEAMLGRPASHGCVRLGREELKQLYELAPRGTRVYIY